MLLQILQRLQRSRSQTLALTLDVGHSGFKAHEHGPVQVRIGHGPHFLQAGEIPVALHIVGDVDDFFEQGHIRPARGVVADGSHHMLILPKDHPYAQYRRLSLSYVENEDFITLNENSDQDTRRAFAAAGIRPNVKFTTKDDYAIISMVEKGIGISIMPELLLRGHLDKIAAIPLDPPLKRNVGIALAPGASPAAKSFADTVKNWLRRGN